jgi:hypothetical protein
MLPTSINPTFTVVAGTEWGQMYGSKLWLVIKRQRIFVCRPTTNIRQNIIAEYSADNNKTDKSNNVISSQK